MARDSCDSFSHGKEMAMGVLDRFRLDGKRLFVTGGSRGLGREMALAIADAGADVGLVGRDLASLEKPAGDVRGLGLLIGVEIVKDRTKKTPDPSAANEICAEAFRRGVYTLNMGSYGGRAIRVAPPLIVTEEQLDKVVEVLDHSMSRVEESRTP